MSNGNHEQEKDFKTLNYNKITKTASFGTAVVVILAIVLPIIGQQIAKKFKLENCYDNLIIIIGIAYFLFLLTGVIIWTIIFSKDRNKEISQIIQEQPEACKELQRELSSIQQVATNLSSARAKSEIDKFILPRKEVDKLEGSIKIDKKILIFTSKFILEQNPNFVKTINRNFRKGVKYIYLVPSDTVKLEEYCERIKGWYNDFSEFTQSQEKANAILEKLQGDKDDGQECNQKYRDLVNQAITAYNNTKSSDKKIKEIQDKLKNMFKKQLLTYKLDKNLFYVTVAMYEEETNKWKAIIKLPTVNQEENFTAFCVSDANVGEKGDFIDNILHLRSPKNQYELPNDVFQ